jgi:sugar transferase (PEP-CTERM system associated)
MIRVFDHYVPTRTVLELSMDFMLLLLAAIGAGITLAAVSGVPLHAADLAGSLLPEALSYALVMLLLFAAFGAYQRDRVGSLRAMLLCMLLATFVSVGPLFFLVLQLSETERHPLHFLGLAYVYQFIALLLIRRPLMNAHSRGLWNRKVLVIGCGTDAQAVAADIEQCGCGAYDLVGFYPSGHDDDPSPGLAAPVLDQARPLASLAGEYHIDDIVVAVREQRGGVLPLRHLLECRTLGVAVHSLAAFSERLKGEVPLDSLKASWLIYGNGFAQGWLRTTVKRLFDVFVALVLLALTWWIMLLAALAIFIEDGAPVLFRQERVGRSGKTFHVLKFRSMRTDAEKDGVARWAQANDSRVTRVGRFVRKTRIDELPQLFNVLRGEMSLVGPRPERPSFVEQLTEQIPFYAIRHSVKPGLTGWAQVRFSYGASLADARRKLQFDLYYVKNHSLVLDAQILLETVRVVVFGEGAR